MPQLEEFCSLDLRLSIDMVGKVPRGLRLDFPFQGVATSPHWEGERPVSGVDYATFRGDGNMSLDLHGRIGEGDQVVAYRGSGVSIVPERGVAEPRELIEFETAWEELAFLNTMLGIGIGRGEGESLRLTIYLVRP
ncbi:MAG: DUF3237 domain-containing protein [Actinomycetota bacterium]|nr:DUF3237 domain-containing protein [Actinomycetota bacterium]